MVFPGRQVAGKGGFDLPAQDIVNIDLNAAGLRQNEADRGLGIEGVGVILQQVANAWQADIFISYANRFTSDTVNADIGAVISCADTWRVCRQFKNGVGRITK